MQQSVLLPENIVLNLPKTSKEEAIIAAGKMLVAKGYVKDTYIQGMLEREKVCNTYIGNGVAIPHGTNAAKEEIIKSGIVVFQYKDGIDYGEDKAYLVIGIAGVGDDHMAILSKIALTIQDMDTVERLAQSNNVSEVYETLLKLNA
jgi:mannitol/fructose-specific phosphotransferase system IIA component